MWKVSEIGDDDIFAHIQWDTYSGAHTYLWTHTGGHIQRDTHSAGHIQRDKCSGYRERDT